MVRVSEPRANTGMLVTVAIAFALNSCGEPANTSPGASPSGSSSMPPPAATPPGGQTSGDDAQVVSVPRFGVSFDVPKTWNTLTAEEVSGPSLDAEIRSRINDFADRLGLSRAEFREQTKLNRFFQSISVDTVSHDRPDSITVLGLERELAEDQVAGMAASAGYEVGRPRRASTDVGDVTLLNYRTDYEGSAAYGVMLAVHVDGGTVLIAAESATEGRASSDLQYPILGSLRRGPGPDA